MPWWPPSSDGLHRADQEVGADAVGDEGLGAVDDVAAVDAASAKVLSEATSEPAPGSVIPSAPILSPLIPGTSQRCFCSSVPNFQIGGVAISEWAPSPAATPPPRARARQLLDPDRVVDVVAALAAVLLGVLEAEEAELAAAREQLVAGTRAPPPTRPRAGRSPWRRTRATDSRRSSCSSVKGGTSARSPVSLMTVIPAASSLPFVVWPRPAWSKPSRSPCGFFLLPWW